jgi:lipopolysaccharide transport system ATP-binding protein
MSKWEIRSKFDEIVAFAEIEKFLDTPVKRYSSGMYVRLAFAVAAHLEPEILIVDEVLAVGDTEFQKKCLGKIKDVSGHGRTVLFVSHNMTAVSSLCDRAILLKAGKVLQDGSAAEVIERYLGSTVQTSGLYWEGPEGDENAQVLHARVCGGAQGTLTTDQPITLELELRVLQPIHGLVVGWELWSQREQLLAYSLVDDTHSPPGEITQPGYYRLQMEIPADTLASGGYRCCLDIGIHNVRRIVPEKSICLKLHVENTAGIGRRYLTNAWTNIFRPAWKWTVLRNGS